MTICISSKEVVIADTAVTYSFSGNEGVVLNEKIYTHFGDVYFDGYRVVAAAASGNLIDAMVFLTNYKGNCLKNVIDVRLSVGYVADSTYNILMTVVKDDVVRRVGITSGTGYKEMTGVSSCGSGADLFMEMRKLLSDEYSIAEVAYLTAVLADGCSPPLSIFCNETFELTRFTMSKERLKKIHEAYLDAHYKAKVEEFTPPSPPPKKEEKKESKSTIKDAKEK